MVMILHFFLLKEGGSILTTLCQLHPLGGMIIVLGNNRDQHGES